MKPFFVLLLAFGFTSAVTYAMNNTADLYLSGKLALSIMLLFTTVGHFRFTKGMSMMLPSFVPAPTLVIIVTGFLEIAAAVCLFVPSLSGITGWCLILMFLLFLPANIYAASKRLNYETGRYDGKGLSYLWFRIPFQLLLIWWTLFFVLQQE